jgi:predicted DNA-binding protein (MmcQ/YjbR family)
MRARSGKSPTTPRRRPSGRTPVERLRAICLALPETTEKLAWGEPTWRVRGRLFAQLDDHHHGADHLAIWLPAPLGEQEAMIFTDPVRFFRPPYVGHRGWVGVRIDQRPDWALVARLVEQAHRQVAPPRRRDAAQGSPRSLSGYRGSPRLRRGGPSVGGLGAMSGPPTKKVRG